MAGAGDIRAGKAYVELTVKNGLVAGLQKAKQQLQNFAGVVRRTARALSLIGTAMAAPFLSAIMHVKEVRSKLEEITKTIGDALAPALMPALEATLKIAQGFAQWAKNNQKLLTTVVKTASGILLVAGAFKLAAASASLLSVAVGVIGGVAGFIAGSPVLATVLGIGAALTAAGAAWMYFTDSGRDAFKTIQAVAGQMLTTVKTAVGGIGDALMAGDLQLAGQIAVKGLQVVFLQGIDMIAGAFEGIIGGVIWSIGNDLIKGNLASAWETVVLGMSATWDAFASGVVSVFHQAISQALNWVNELTAQINRALDGLKSMAGFTGNKFVTGALKAIIGGAQAGTGVAMGALSAGAGALSSSGGKLSAGLKASASDSAGRFTGKLAQAPRPDDELASLKDQLDALRKRAADARAGIDFTSLQKVSSASATSAGGALALTGGAGGTVQDRILRSSDKILAANLDQKRLLEKIAANVWVRVAP